MAFTDLFAQTPSLAVVAIVVAALLGAALGWFSFTAAERIASVSGSEQSQTLASLRLPRGWRVLSAVVGAVFFASTLLVYGLNVVSVFICLLGLILLVISLVDAAVSIIPDSLVSTGLAVWLLYVAALVVMGSSTAVSAALSGLLAAVVIGGLLLLLSLVMDKVLHTSSLGGGDIKLFAMVSLYLGLAIGILNLILACIIGVVFAFAWGGAKGRAGVDPAAAGRTGVDLAAAGRADAGSNASVQRMASRAFPFGPAISVATWVSILFGSALIGVYLGFF